MPDLDVLPAGPRREFVEFMFMLYLDAHLPAFEKLSKEIENADYRATASKETIRKIYAGDGITVEWQIIEAIVLALCALSGLDPDSSQLFHDRENTLMGHADRLWTLAVQEPPAKSSRSAQHRDGPKRISEFAVPVKNNGRLHSGFSGN